ncbi:MAG: phospholipase [Chitinophagaceae bacterium]|nr:MAG: phospholipase [Chitinophagaceae bacterium]
MKRKSFIYLSLCFFICCCSLFSASQDLTQFEKRWMVQGGDTLPYRVLLPLNFDSAKKYPVVFFLHGAGERGRDNEKQLVHGGKLFLRQDVRTNFPAIVIFPQCSENDYWSNVLRLHNAKGKRSFEFIKDGSPTTYMTLLQELIAYTLQSSFVKKDQVYIGGLSMGGMGTYEVVRRMPKTFAAAFAICGGAHPQTAKQLKKVDWWIFHGAKDDVVPPEASEKMVDALKKAGADVKFTLYPAANHNSWDPAFAEKDLLPWLFSHKK